jgi:lipoprotein NlpI
MAQAWMFLAAASAATGVFLSQGRRHEAFGRHTEAVAAYSRVLRLDPKNVEAYDRRGSENFKLGKVDDSAKDFDEAVRLRPELKPGHWRRGISLYYAGRYADGRDQFKGYEEVDTNDVENAVWHFLCVARLDGVEKARAGMLKIGKDRRVPMTEVYELFAGKLKPADVLAAADAGPAGEVARSQRLFYAHLYLGLYADVSGDRKTALEHLELAAGRYRIAHYMGDAARVHEELLRKQLTKK